MKLKRNKRIRIFIITEVLLILSFSIFFSLNLKDNTSINPDSYILSREDLKISKVSGKIHIDNNWTESQIAGICTGSGIYSNPYVIEDLIIAFEGRGPGILIENSDVYFRIENCSISNCSLGIYLSYVNNSQLINNNFSTEECGIELYYSDNNTILGNIVSNENGFNPSLWGIYTYESSNNSILKNIIDINQQGITLVWRSDNNIISGNIINRSDDYGIKIENCKNINASGNILSFCGLEISGSLEELDSHYIDSTNLVNDKPLYYYSNEIGLDQLKFSNGGQVILVDCRNSTISRLNISNVPRGISLYYCETIKILNNHVFNNTEGIYIESSEKINIFGNTVEYNYDYGIITDETSFSNISDNIVRYNFRQDPGLSSTDWGIYSVGDRNKISRNNVSYNPIGIASAGAFNTILGNIADHNSIRGIDIDGFWNIISENIANNNDGGGISLRGKEHTLSGNTANNNSGSGIYLSLSYESDILGNIANNNNYGILVYMSEYNQIRENTAEYNHIGIRLWDSHHNTISGNKLNGNDKCIEEEDCVGNKFKNNQYCDYGEAKGIPLELVIAISITGGAVAIGIATFLLIRKKRKL